MPNTGLNHVAVFNRSEKEAKKFYGSLLGLRQTYRFTVDESLAQRIFSMRINLEVLIFENDHLKIEVFISAHKRIPVATAINHICVEVEQRPAFLQKCRQQEIEFMEIQRERGKIIFLKDYSGNLFEIKERRVEPDN